MADAKIFDSISEAVGITSLKLEKYCCIFFIIRAICNDPLVMGFDYTEKLEKACATFLRLTKRATHLELQENRSVVFNILRGGLNFGLRGALVKAFGWNNHSTSFVTAQRARVTESPEQWHITEDEYKKIIVPKRAQIIIGDVVATGTSLKHGLDIMINVPSTTPAPGPSRWKNIWMMSSNTGQTF